MPVESNPTLINGSFVWTYPGCPLRILFSLRVLERLRAQIPPVQPSTPGGKPRQFGGLLIGRKKTKPGITNVVDFIPLFASVDPTSSQFTFLPEWLDEVASRCPGECKIVGYYRTSSDDSIRLGDDDLKLIQQRFSDPSNIFLVIAPGKQGASAGFFCQHNGAVPANCRLTFPLSANELASGGWPIRNGSSLRERLAHLAVPLLHPGDLRSGLWTKGVSAALVIALLATGGVLLKRSLSARAAVAAAPAAPSVSLRVERSGASFLLSWDRSAPQIATTLGGSLEIREGTKPVSLLSLTPEQLRVGSLSYGSYPYSDEAEFRLRIVGATGLPSAESSASPSPGGAAAVASPEPPIEPSPVANLEDRPVRPARTRAREDDYPPIPVVPERRATVAVNTEPLRDDDQKPQTQQPPVKHPSSRRAFVPPETKPPVKPAEAPNITIPEPPSPGRLRTPSSSTVSLELANSVPVIKTTPPSAETPSPVSARPPVVESVAGLLTITSEPSGASVQINDVLAGTTPLALQMSPVGLGFTVTITKSGFAKWTLQSVATDQPATLHARLRPK